MRTQRRKRVGGGEREQSVPVKKLLEIKGKGDGSRLLSPQCLWELKIFVNSINIRSIPGRRRGGHGVEGAR